MASTPLTILADHRERASGVIGALEKLGVPVHLRALPVADYVVAARVGIERKTIRDLHRSIENRRLWSQVASLRADLVRAFLVVEGDDLDRGPISAAGVRGALLAVAELGIVILRTRDSADTALWLSRIAARHGGARARPRRVFRSLPHGHPPTPVNVLASLPGISPAVAQGLLDHFGSIAAVATADRQELLSVPSIGDKRADTLIRLLGRARSL